MWNDHELLNYYQNQKKKLLWKVYKRNEFSSKSKLIYLTTGPIASTAGLLPAEMGATGGTAGLHKVKKNLAPKKNFFYAAGWLEGKTCPKDPKVLDRAINGLDGMSGNKCKSPLGYKKQNWHNFREKRKSLHNHHQITYIVELVDCFQHWHSNPIKKKF